MSLMAAGIVIGMFVGTPLGVLVMCCLVLRSRQEKNTLRLES